MGYPIYKLLRAVNRQYPNNGFINYVDVREDTYDNTEDQMIDEDLRDLINETIQEVYKDVAIDEVYSFPTVPGQNQYVLPEDCDLRDIQEVTRTYQGYAIPVPEPYRPEPGEDVVVTFTISEEFGTLFATKGTIVDTGTVTYSVPSGGIVPEIPIVEIDPSFDFLGWSIDGTTVVTIDEIKYMSITEPTTFVALADTHYTFGHTVTFSVNPADGSIGGASAKRYQVADGQTLTELPVVIANEEKEFLGWTLDGTTIIGDSVILSTPVTEDIYYIGKFKNEEEEEMRNLTDDMTLTDGVAPTLEGGFYYTGPHSVFVSGATLPIFGSYSVFYYDAASQTLTGPFASATYTNGMWEIYRDAMLATSVANNDRIPINSAVNAAIGGATSIATASLTTDFSSTADETVETIPLDDFDIIGGFEHHPLGGYIAIPSESNITKVKISANIQCEVDTTSSGITRFFYVIKEASGGTKTTLKDTFISTTASGTIYEILSFAPFVIDVEPGDKIYLATMAPSQVSRKIVGDADTYLTVEEVKDTTAQSENNGGGSNDNPLGG